MFYTKFASLTLICFLILSSCQGGNKEEIVVNESIIHSLFDYLNEAIIYDGFPPPVASRIYAYCAVGAYEATTYNNSNYKSLSGQLNGLNNLPAPVDGVVTNSNIVLITCFTEVGKSLVYRDYFLDSAKVHLTKVYIPKGVSKKIIKESEAYGKVLADAIIKWSREDLYKETRSYPIYTVNKEPSSWQSTWPTYGQALEPHWGSIRPFIIDTATKESCEKHIPFDTIPGSEFYNQVIYVQKFVSEADSSKIEIAKFWDCNPAPTDKSGRIALRRRQLTPGGHWIGIVKTLCLQSNMSNEEVSDAYLRCAIAIADGFISTWGEKYSSDLIRPETFINRYIDSEWRPLLETPLFPEYPSAHSTISAAAATVLTPIFGDSITYIDSVNYRFGPIPREFHSLREAADEAGISRVYGGIHYPKSIDAGKKLGNNIGAFLNQNLITKLP